MHAACMQPACRLHTILCRLHTIVDALHAGIDAQLRAVARKVTVLAYAGFGSVSLRKSATELLCAKPVSSRVVRHLLAYLSVHK